MRSFTAPQLIVAVPFIQIVLNGQGPLYGSLYLFNCLFLTSTVSRNLHVCGLLFLFSFWFFSYIPNYLCFLLYSDSAMDGVFNTISRPNIRWLGVDCNIVWYMLRTSKTVYDSIPDQRSSLSRQLYCKSNVHTKFLSLKNCIIISIFLGIQYACTLVLDPTSILDQIVFKFMTEKLIPLITINCFRPWIYT